MKPSHFFIAVPLPPPFSASVHFRRSEVVYFGSVDFAGVDIGPSPSGDFNQAAETQIPRSHSTTPRRLCWKLLARDDSIQVRRVLEGKNGKTSVSSTDFSASVDFRRIKVVYFGSVDFTRLSPREFAHGEINRLDGSCAQNGRQVPLYSKKWQLEIRSTEQG